MENRTATRELNAALARLNIGPAREVRGLSLVTTPESGPDRFVYAVRFCHRKACKVDAQGMYVNDLEMLAKAYVASDRCLQDPWLVAEQIQRMLADRLGWAFRDVVIWELDFVRGPREC